MKWKIRRGKTSECGNEREDENDEERGKERK